MDGGHPRWRARCSGCPLDARHARPRWRTWRRRADEGHRVVGARRTGWSAPSSRRGGAVGLDESRPDQRLATARATAELCDVLRGLQGLPLIERLAAADVAEPTRRRSVAGERGRRRGQAGRLRRGTGSTRWSPPPPAGGRAGRRGGRDPDPPARGALTDDEFTTQLARRHQRTRTSCSTGWPPGQPGAVHVTDPRAGDDDGKTMSRRAGAPASAGEATIGRGQGGACPRQLHRFVVRAPGSRRRRRVAGRMTADVVASAPVTPAVARAFIDQARHKNYHARRDRGAGPSRGHPRDHLPVRRSRRADRPGGVGAGRPRGDPERPTRPAGWSS